VAGKKTPETDDREPEVVNGQYNDDDESYAPLLDEGWFESDRGDEGE